MNKKGATTVMCSVLAIDHSNLSYKACSSCERTLSDTPNSHCGFCNNFNPSSSNRFFRLIVSVATDSKVLNVICFDRAARILFGCFADHFFHFAEIHPLAGANASKVLDVYNDIIKTKEW